MLPRPARPLLAALLACALPACATLPTYGAKAQEAAQELNVNARFGRMEMAVEQVAPKEREKWADSHRGWGGAVRIADTEMAGMKMVKEDEAEILVKVAWYRPDEQELRVTTLKQKYKDVNGEMKLVEEKRIDGDLGLFGEKIDRAPQKADERPKPPARFPTVRIGGGDDGAVYRTE